MRTTFRLFTAFATIVLAVASWSCKPSGINDVVDTTTSVKFDQEVVDLGYEETTVTLHYTINNGIEGIDIVASSEAEWISEIDAANGTLTFRVAENQDVKARETKLRVTYPNADTVYVVVKQAEFDAITFELEVTANSSTSCSTLIKPSNEDYAYIAYMAEVDYFLSAQITTAEELFQDDYDYYMAFAKQWEAPLLKEFFLMNYIAYQGEYSIEWTGMVPDKEYVLYVYAIEFNEANDDYWMASPITY